jgi:2-phospho-L-lactate guanylyltransferase (CobY/MobA/RfbA family)
MTTVVVLAAAPGDTDPLGLFVPDTLSAAEARALSQAMLADVCAVVQEGAADLLVNYPAPDDTASTDTAESSLREFLDGELSDPGEVRYEPQVGTGRAARVGNALTHLLTEEGEESVAVVEPTALFLRREHVGTAAMKLRTSDVVLGPAPGGRVTFAGFREPIDFTDIYTQPAVETFTGRATDAGLDVDFLAMTPLLATPADLSTAVSVLTARREAGRLVPPRTAGLLEEWGLTVGADGQVSRASDND